MRDLPEKPNFHQRNLAWINWGVIILFCIFQFCLQTSASIMTKPWMRDFHLGPVGVSNLSSAFFYSYLIMQLPVGYFYDHFNSRHNLTLGAFLVAAGCLLLSQTDHTTLAFIARMLMGVGSAFGFIGMLYICARWFSPGKFALMISLAESLGMISVGLLTILSAWLITHYGWRVVMLGAGILAVMLMIVAYTMVRGKEVSNTVKADRASLGTSLAIIYKNKELWLSGFFGFFTFAIVNVISSLWGVPFLVNTYHLSLSASAAIISSIMYGIAIGTPLVSWGSMRIGRRKPLMLLGSFLTTIALCAALFVPNLSEAALVVLFFITGICGSSYILSYAVGKESTPTKVHGVSMAFANMVLMLSAPVLQSLTAFMIKHGLTYRVALGIIPLGTAIAFLLALGIKETYCTGLEERNGVTE